MFEFQKKPPLDFQSLIFPNGNLTDLFYPKTIFWNVFSYFTDDNFTLGFGSSPKDRTVMLSKFIVNGANTHHPFMELKTSEIRQISDIVPREFTLFDISHENKNVLAVKKIIDTLHQNNIDVIIFSVPNVEPYLS